jgi:hexosaminidase
MKYTILLLLFFCLSGIGEAQSSLNLIPQPQSIVPLKGAFHLNSATIILHSPHCEMDARLLQLFLAHHTGYNLQLAPFTEHPDSNYIFLEAMIPDPGLLPPNTVPGLPGSLAQVLVHDDHEAYRLSITPRSVMISGRTTAGVGHGIQTLKQMTSWSASREELLPVSWNCMMIQDKPAFGHRGLLLDCCRHFMDVDFIKKYIDLLAFYKMNVLHWHLTEDQGWRIEIMKYPLLTEIGGFRKEADGSTYGGFYTQAQIKHIVAYAAERHITIIPEIEMPGHSVAAIASYPYLGCTQDSIDVETEWGVFKDIYCAGNDSTIQFLKDVLTEVCSLFPGPYIHIGGDEAPKFRWGQCARCQKRMTDEHIADEAALQTWLIEEMAAFLTTKNKRIIGWDEILEGGIPADAAIQSWRGIEGGEMAAKAKHAVIMSPTSHCYFDYGLQSIDAEKVYQFDPVPSSLTEAESQYIRGAECNMWTEHAPQNLVDGKVFPRMLAMSEVLWTYPSVRNYKTFSKKITAHHSFLKQMDVTYGLAKIPGSIAYRTNSKGQLVIDIKPTVEGIEFVYTELPYYSDDFQLTADRLGRESTIEAVPQANYVKDSIVPPNAVLMDIIPVLNNVGMRDQRIQICVDQHVGFGKKVTRNFTTNPYYPASGDNALTDGLCHVGGFRDGFWQGVVQKDLEVIVDLQNAQTIHFCNSNWYHYANAWIFRPTQVQYMGSMDGTHWTTLGTFKAAVEASDKKEIALPYPIWFEPTKARYIKMIVNGIGNCPDWHDAPGEPSWLFGDELIIR